LWRTKIGDFFRGAKFVCGRGLEGVGGGVLLLSAVPYPPPPPPEEGRLPAGLSLCGREGFEGGFGRWGLEKGGLGVGVFFVGSWCWGFG